MASKKKGTLSKFCRIFQWVETQDPALSGAIRELCLEGALSPGDRAAGITFLFPKEKAYREEIIDKTYSDEADDAEKLVNSLIIPDYLASGPDFSRRAVGSRLGVKFAVESADANTVKLANGVELKRADDFHSRGKRAENIAVWNVTKGRLPIAGEAYSAPAPVRRGAKPAVRGGADAALSERRRLAEKTEDEYNSCMLLDRCATFNPYLAKVVSLLNYLKARQPDLFVKLLPILDYDPVVTFYLLLEPYKTAGEYLVPDGLLFGEGGWNCTSAYSNAVEEYKAMFAGLPRQSAASASDPQSRQPAVPYAFRDRGAVMAQIDQIRQKYANLAPRQGPQAVQDVYAILASQNVVQGLGPVLPDATLAALTGSKKLWQDEFRFTIHEAMQTMRQGPYDPRVFASIVRDIRTAWPGNRYDSEIRLSNVADLRVNVAPRTELLLLGKFVNSTDFLYLPAPPDAVGEAWGGAGDPSDWSVYNRNQVALANLGRIRGMAPAEGVSAQTLQELQIYVAAHGQLPPAVAALGARV